MRLLFTIVFSTLTFLGYSQNRPQDFNRVDINDRPSERRTVYPILQLAETQYRTNNVEEAAELYNNAVGQNPLSAEAHISRARYRSRIGRTAEAKLDIAKANSINPFIADLYGFSGVGGLLNLAAYHPKNDLHIVANDTKLHIYSQYLHTKLEKDNVSHDMGKYESVIQKLDAEQYEAALEETDQLITDQAGNNPILYDLRGYLLDNLGDPEGAIDAFTLATAIEPDFYISWFNLGVAEVETGTNDVAMSHLNKSIEINPEFSIAYMKRAYLLDQLGDDESAIKDYTKVIDLGGEAMYDALLDRGLLRMVVGDYSGAIADLNRTIDKFPNDAKLRLNRGVLNLVFGENDQAFNDFSKAIELDQDYSEAYHNRALSRFLSYEYEQGCFDLQKSSELGLDKSDKLINYFCVD